MWNWVFVPLIQMAAQASCGFVLGYFSGELVGGAIGAGITGIFGAILSWSLAAKRSYNWSSVPGCAQYIVDCTWSVTNTVVGAVFLTLSYITFNFPSTTVSSEYQGFLVLRRGVFPGFATTLGNVIAGGTPGILRHEGGHVLQARIFGPIYIPLVIANYIVATLLPYWLVYHDHGRKPIKSLGAYFMRGVYPHVWNEEWAYGVQGTPP
jgi:hypothetical protein